MKNLKIFTASILMTSLVLSGCSGKSDISSSQGGITTIKVFHHMSEQTKRDGLKNLMDEFTKENPNVKFEEEAISQDSYKNTLKTKLAAGDAPDIIMGTPYEYTDLVDAGHIMDLTGQSFYNNIQDLAIPSVKIKDKLYGIPLDVQAHGIFYNKDVFKEAGVEVPQTYSDLVKVCETLKSKNIVPFAQGFKDGWTAQVNFQSDFNATLKKIPDFYTQVSERSKKFADYPELKGTLERDAKLLTYGEDDPFSVDYATSLSMVATGKAAMVIQGNWAAGELRKANTNGNLGFFVNPISDNESENLMSSGVDDAFMISSQTKVKDQAIKFFEFVASKSGADIWTKASNTVSVVKDASSESLDPMLQDVMKYINDGKSFNFQSVPGFSGQYDSTFRTAEQEFAANQGKDIDGFIKNLDDQFDKIKATSK